MLRTVMSSIMRRRRGLISAIWKLLSEGWDRHPHPLRQETCHATKPLTPRQRLLSIRTGLAMRSESVYEAPPAEPEGVRPLPCDSVGLQHRGAGNPVEQNNP